MNAVLPNPQVLCVGETMAVVTPLARESLSIAEGCLLGTGGAESNVASHLARLGIHTAWVSRVGNDAFGDRIIAELTDRGVDTRWAAQDNAAPTGIYFKEPDTGSGARVLYYRSGSAASHLCIESASEWPLASSEWVHLSGITPALSPDCAELTAHLLRSAAQRGYSASFDVNYRPSLWPVEDAGPALLALASLADTVLVGLDEAEVLWNCTSADDVATLLPEPAHLIVKDSSIEAVEYERDGSGHQQRHSVPARSVTVVEPVGAGDAFAAGYLAGRIQGASAVDRLSMGHSLAAWTLGSRADYRPWEGDSLIPAQDTERISIP